MKNFKCQRCGNCCNMHGYVCLEEGEVDAIADFMDMSTSEFINTYTEIMPDRRGLTLAEFADGRCVFLLEDNSCQINDVKPQQCRNFPEQWCYPIGDETCPACNPSYQITKYRNSKSNRVLEPPYAVRGKENEKVDKLEIENP